MIKNFLRKFIPKFILSWYHLGLAHLANFIYGQPSEKIIIIGVTGTNGKSTTVNLISKILEEAGFKTAISSTVNFKIGDREWLNDLKMTMPGRFFLQKLLSDAVKTGCQFAIIESSSEGILQHRHMGIHFDAMVFTNLTPEHIEAHGGFENYKKAKREYFSHLQNLPHKIIAGKKIPKIIAANLDDPHGCDFMLYHVDKKISFGKNGDLKIKGSDLSLTEQGISFNVNGTKFNLRLKGIFDFYNALAAVALTSGFDVELNTAKLALEKIPNVPGRMELIEEGQNFKVLVDYAPEPEGIRQLYATVKSWPDYAKASTGKPHKKIIHLLGSTGGGRDTSRRKILGQLAGTNADIVIVTNEDPYNDNPQEIIHQVADGAVEAGKIIKENLFRDPDRRNAIAKAFSLAKEGDLVMLTGKGAEQKMAVRNGYIPWDDREVAKEELKKLLNN
jgi:UDP-N-acetylmuramoyl-L-alanyl-D-glutamate--2,6-diaminopimelate ligase